MRIHEPNRRTALLFLTTCALSLPLAFCGCLENEEDFTIKPDCSVELRITAKGDSEDLLDGYAAPIDGPWEPASADAAELWKKDPRAAVDPQTIRRLRELGYVTDQPSPARKQIALVYDGSFASVDAIPRFFAPEAEPYRTAFLERSASLRVETKSGR